jgi:hypothetical protein
MRIRVAILPVGILVLTMSSATAYEPKDAANNASHEMVECAVFYTISEQGARNRGTVEANKMADELQKIAETAINYAVLFAEEAGQSQKATLARIELTHADLMKQMDHNYVNFSVLLAKYADPCKAAVEHPEKRYEYWLAKTPE